MEFIHAVTITKDDDGRMVAEVETTTRTVVLMPTGPTRTRRLRTLFRQLLALEESTTSAE